MDIILKLFKTFVNTFLRVTIILKYPFQKINSVWNVPNLSKCENIYKLKHILYQIYELKVKNFQATIYTTKSRFSINGGIICSPIISKSRKDNLLSFSVSIGNDMLMRQ